MAKILAAKFGFVPDCWMIDNFIAKLNVYTMRDNGMKLHFFIFWNVVLVPVT